MGVHFEDFSAGQVIEGAPITVDRAEMLAFARAFDPQPFHLDERQAASSFPGKLIASGWFTAALGMRLLHRDGFGGHSSMGAPGVEELRWLRPVVPGERLRLHLTVEETRASASKRDRGYVRFLMRLDGDDGAAAMTQAFSVMFARRGAEPLPPRALAPDEPARPLPPGEAARPLRFLAQTEPGTVRELGHHRFEAEAIRAFARAYDPQLFHTDPEAARKSHFGGLCASGWHSAAVWMQRLDATLARDAALTARTGPVPRLGPSPGFRDMRWLAPVHAGDTLRYACRLVERRQSRSRPGWGLATHRNDAVNQRGETVFEFTGTVFWQWAP